MSFLLFKLWILKGVNVLKARGRGCPQTTPTSCFCCFTESIYLTEFVPLQKPSFKSLVHTTRLRGAGSLSCSHYVALFHPVGNNEVCGVFTLHDSLLGLHENAFYQKLAPEMQYERNRQDAEPSRLRKKRKKEGKSKVNEWMDRQLLYLTATSISPLIDCS